MSNDSLRRPKLQPWVRLRPPAARNHTVRDPYFCDELLESLDECLRRNPAECHTEDESLEAEDAEVLDTIFADDEWCSRGIGRGGLCSDDICRGLGLCMYENSCARHYESR